MSPQQDKCWTTEPNWLFSRKLHFTPQKKNAFRQKQFRAKTELKGNFQQPIAKSCLSFSPISLPPFAHLLLLSILLLHGPKVMGWTKFFRGVTCPTSLSWARPSTSHPPLCPFQSTLRRDQIKCWKWLRQRTRNGFFPTQPLCKRRTQGCQMVYFQTQIPNLGTLLEGLGMGKVGIFYVWPFEIYYGHITVHFMGIW
jgi:hypothetical protein